MLLSGCPSDQHGGDTSEGSQSVLQQEKKSNTTMFAQRAMQERRLKPPEQVIACPRCQSLNTKFCYYNNYSLSQPRHFCKNCRRYWTAGGTLRNVPVGGGCRKNKRAKQRNNDLSTLSVDSSVSAAMRVDGTGSALHSAYNPSSASTSAGYFENHSFEEATKMALSRTQHSLRAGPSGVSQSTEGSGICSNGHLSAFSVAPGSHSTGLSHSSAQSAYEPSPNLIGLSFYTHQHKDINGLVGAPDLGMMFDSQQSANYRAAAAAAAAAGAGAALSEGITYHGGLEIDHHLSLDPETQWRMQHQHHQSVAAQQAKQLWAAAAEDDQDQRESGRQLQIQHVDDKSLVDMRLAKGKTAMSLSPSRGHDQTEAPAETTRPHLWQAMVHDSLPQGYEPTAHEQSGYVWGNNSWGIEVQPQTTNNLL